jgi:hypothetical protein
MVDIAQRWPARPMCLAGFSLGGNFALRAADNAMGEVLGRILEYADDGAGVVSALADLDDALAQRREARLRGEVPT